MGDNPKQTEAKYTRIHDAWKTLAPDSTFGGMTIAQFELQLAQSNAPRQRLNELDDEIRGQQTLRETADMATVRACEAIVKSVIADPTFGDDSALYEAMGYVRKSNRKSGLTRKGRTGDANKPKGGS